WRAVLSAVGESQRAAFGSAPSGGPELPLAQAAPLRGLRLERTLRLPQPAVVHVHGDSGVCALFTQSEMLSTDGLGGGCELHRLLPAGEAQLAVRSFAGVPLTGSLFWTADAVEDLGEG